MGGVAYPLATTRQRLAPLNAAPWRVVAARLQPQTVLQGLDSRRVIHGLRGELDLTELTPLGAQLLAAGSYLHAGGEAPLGFGWFRWRQNNHSD